MYSGWISSPTPKSDTASAQIIIYDGRRRVGVVKIDRIRRKFRIVVGKASSPFKMQIIIPVVKSKCDGSVVWDIAISGHRILLCLLTFILQARIETSISKKTCSNSQKVYLKVKLQS